MDDWNWRCFWLVGFSFKCLRELCVALYPKFFKYSFNTEIQPSKVSAAMGGMQLKIASASFVGEIRVLDSSSAMVLFVVVNGVERKVVVAVGLLAAVCCVAGVDGCRSKWNGTKVFQME